MFLCIIFSARALVWLHDMYVGMSWLIRRGIQSNGKQLSTRQALQNQNQNWPVKHIYNDYLCRVCFHLNSLVQTSYINKYYYTSVPYQNQTG